MFVCCECFVL